MGTWDIGSFDNDQALDWAGELEQFDDLSFVEHCLVAVIEIPTTDELDADLAVDAIAAAEVVAALAGHPGPLPEEVRQWLDAHPSLDPGRLRAMASTAIGRILGARSELDTLWRQSEQYDAWKRGVAELRRRLEG